MPKPRTCPHCNQAAEVVEGYDFDNTGNLICPRCSKIMYPITEEAETALDTAIKSKSQTSYGTGVSYPKYDAWNNKTSYAETSRTYTNTASAVEEDDAA